MILLKYLVLVIALYCSAVFLLRFIAMLVSLVTAVRNKEPFSDSIKFLPLTIAVLAWAAFIVFF